MKIALGADEIAAPLGLDLHIGLPHNVDRNRVARLHQWKRAESLLHLKEMPSGFAMAALNPVGLAARATGVPRDVDPFAGDYNRDEVRAVEMPSSNGIGTARAVAKLYGTAATGGEDDDGDVWSAHAPRVGVEPTSLVLIQSQAGPAGRPTGERCSMKVTGSRRLG